MAKQLSNQLGTLSSPPNDASCVDLNAMSMDSFRLWSTSALKVFLSIRGRKTEGSFDELVARAFIAWEDQLAVDPNKEHAMRLNLDEYKNRLKIKSRVLPDPFTITEGWLNEEGRLNWPSLYFSDICEYLKMRTSAELHHRLINEYKQGKSFRYFSCGFVKEVFYNPVSDTCPVAFLAAKVTPSMSLNSSPHEAWICLEKDSTYQPGGEIHTAYCTCTAGLNGCCNHVAAILFRVEYAVRTGMTKPSSTSEKCVWNVPSIAKAPTKPLKLCEQIWTKDQYFKQNDGQHSKSIQHLATLFSPLTKAQEEYVSSEEKIKCDLANIIRNHASSSCFIQLYDKTPFTSKSNPECPPEPKQLAMELGHPTTVRELVDAMTLTEKQTLDLQNSTIGQSSNENWLQQRIGRITASNFHKVYTKMNSIKEKPSSHPVPLIKTLMGYKRQPNSIGIKHGKAMEPLAKRSYKSVLSSKHKCFRTTECGLFISREHPFLGASPDLLTSCSCCGKGLCEIKCPESIKDMVPTFANYKHLVKDDSGLSTLSRMSEYYTQIQGQMAILSLSYCDLFVYTAKGHHIERIQFDPVFWNKTESNLTEFWETYIAKELIYGSLAENENMDTSLSDHTYINTDIISNQAGIIDHLKSESSTSKGPLSRPKLPLVYLCGKCADVIEENPKTEQQESVECSQCHLWFHRLCASLPDFSTVSGNQEWLCFNCT